MNYGPDISTYEGKTIGLYGGKFLPFHNGHLNMILKAAQMVDILFVAVGYDDDYDRSLCKGTKFEWVDHRTRERWITKALRDFKNIRVLSQYEKRSDDYMNDPTVMLSNQELLAKIGGRLDFVFSSEHEYNDYFAKYLPMAEHIVLDSDRKETDISATRVREEGVYQQWEMLPQSVREDYVKRVALCGIESVGKTTLTKYLAAALGTNFVLEYGRTFYEEINGCYEIDRDEDFNDIVAGHIHAINQASKLSNKILLIDTDTIYTDYFLDLSDRQSDAVETMANMNVERIDAYIYIEPHVEHELEGTRRPIEDEERKFRNSYLKHKYAMYSRDLIFVDEPDALKRYEACKEIIGGLIK